MGKPAWQADNKVGEGIVQKVNDWKPSMNWADLIFVTDNTHPVRELTPYFKAGYPIFGPSFEASKLELDREVGQRAFHHAGMATMGGETFTDYNKAIEYVKSTMGRYVSKPSGDADKALSYVSKSPQDMVFMLERWKKLGKTKQPFILQEFNPGIEMAVGGWFGPNGWSKNFLENFEHKKLMPGDLGVNTGEQGTVMRYVKDSKLVDMCLKPLTYMLQNMNYRGYLDVAVMINDKGIPLPLEFTARPGWPCFVIQTALHEGDPAQWMLDSLHGKDTLKVSTDIATGVVVSIPDYPYGIKAIAEVSGFPIYAPDHLLTNGVHLCEVKRGVAPFSEGGKVRDKEMYVTAGNYTYVATGTGDTVKQSSKRAYRVIDQVELPNSPGYRIDIGDRLENQLPKLQKMGFAEGWTYE